MYIDGDIIISLYDLWSKAVNHWTGQKIWCRGGGTAAVEEVLERIGYLWRFMSPSLRVSDGVSKVRDT